MSNITLHTDIEFPVIRRGKPTPFPLAEQQVGQSFFVDIGTEDEGKVMERVRNAVARWKKTNDKKAQKYTFAVMQSPDSLEPAVGVKRTA